jgi:DNA polymerase III delta prime subunit
MNQLTFINKYKPYYFQDLNLTQQLNDIICSLFEIDDLNLLILGPSNSGKTIMLDCLIRKYYNLNKNQSFPYNNIMIINNLKEQGVNYYRNEMKTFCQSHSTIPYKKKMVIIDDMDTLSEQSQQVFRNYIDKYKNNINFITVCSNIQKIIDSIQSRLYIFKLQPLSNEYLLSIINNITEKESINIDSQSKNYLLKISDNNIRTIINNLEKIYIYSNDYFVDFDNVKLICSSISTHIFENYINQIKKRNLIQSIDILYSLYDFGYSVIDILEFFFHFIKITDNLNEIQKYNCIPIICKYITIFNKLQEDVIELSFFTNDLFNVI